MPDLVDAVPAMERRGDGKDALVGGIDQLLINVLHQVVFRETQELVVDRADSLLEGFFE